MRNKSGVLVAGAMLLFVAVFIGALIVIAQGQIDEDAGTPTPLPAAGTGCEFVPAEGPVLVYGRYDGAAPDVNRAVSSDQRYVVTRLSAPRVEIVLDAEHAGWVDRAAGALRGACDDLPVADAD